MSRDHSHEAARSGARVLMQGAGGHAALALLAFCLFAGAILAPQLSRMRAVPDLGDPLFSIWRMGWVYQQLRGDDRALFDAPIFHPEPLTFTFSDSLLLPATAAAPLHLFGLHPVVAYNVVLIASFILSALAAYALVARLTGSPAAGYVSGLIFGFYPYRFEHYSHLELQMTMLMPLCIWGIHLYVIRGRTWGLAAAAVLAAAQMYCSMYYGLFFALYAVVVFGVWCGTERVRPLRRLGAHAAGASALSALLVAPLAAPYLASANVKKGRSPAEVTHFSATPMDFLRAHRRSAVWSGRTPPGRQEERQLFPGLTILVLAAAGVLASADRRRWAFVAAGLLAFDASLGTNGLVYPRLYEWLPPFRSMRVPARFSILVGLSLAVLAGYAVARLGTLPRAARAAAVLLMTVGITADVWPVLALTEVWRSPPSIYTALSGRRDVVLAEFPAGPPERFPATPYLYFAVWHQLPMLNGYSGYHPASYTRLLDALERFPDPATIATLHARRVTHVTVNCALFRTAGYAGRCDRTLTGAALSPRLREMARAEWQGGPVVLFELVR